MGLHVAPLQPKKRGGYLQIGLALLLISGGGYLLFNTMAPQLYMGQALSEWNEPVVHAKAAKLTQDRIYIPKIKLNLTYKPGGEEVLSQNAWHRFPERGNPEKGGNFILAGHRFQLGIHPGETIRKSPLYHIDKLTEGDSIFVDFNGKRYKYQVTHRYQVQATQTEVEAASGEDRLTLYSCDLYDPKKIRVIVQATQVAKNIDPVQRF
ncbi:MAG TPA: sortase [Candidatus Saccharimonadales bacterium]